jgi:allantoinase
MRFDALVRGGTLVTERAVLRADLGIREGRVAAWLAPDESAGADEFIDARGLHVLPGVVDAHVHFNEPGRTHWEGFQTGTAAAAVGGTTTVMDMPLNSSPPTLDVASLEIKRAAIAGKAHVDYALWGGIVTDNTASLDALYGAGVVAAKAFMCPSGIDEFPRATDGVIIEALKIARERNAIVGLHAESADITEHLGDQLVASGRRDARAWAHSRPPATELEAVQRGLVLASLVPGSRVHFVHLSTAEAVRAVADARRRGIRATCETCPHYLSLTEDDLDRLGPIGKCAPPLRTASEVEALWRVVLAGDVDLIASDHSPSSPEEKQRGDGDIWQAWGGLHGVQTLLATLLAEGVHRRGLSLPALVRLVSGAPAGTYGLWPRKGSLEIGADADMALVDLDREWHLAPEDLRTRHAMSPLLGQALRGRVTATVLRGVTIARDGAIATGSPAGMLVAPTR